VRTPTDAVEFGSHGFELIDLRVNGGSAILDELSDV
jgi:hypothetical protein